VARYLLIRSDDVLYFIIIIVMFSFSTRDGGEVSTRDLQKIVQALPQYSEQVEKLTLHIEVDDCFKIISVYMFNVFMFNFCIHKS
jgi:hypothetical protein